MRRLGACLIACTAALPAFAGSDVIHIETERGGVVLLDSGAANLDGALFWNGAWGVNETYGHMYFMDLRTGKRLKEYTTTVFTATEPAADLVVQDSYRVRRRLVQVTDPPAAGGRSYSSLEFRVELVHNDQLWLLLRSRPLLDDPSVATFDLFVQDAAEPTAVTTSIRDHLVWYASSGTPDELAGVPPIPADRQAELISSASSYWFDIDGGSDMGGTTVQVHTNPFSAGRVAAVGGGASIESVSLKFTSRETDSPLIELRFMPAVTGLTQAEPLLRFPGVASAPGENGTQWRSEVVLANPGERPETACLELVPRDASAATASLTRTLAAGEVHAIDDLYQALGAPTGAGMLRVTGDLRTWVRTFNKAPSGTFGQDIPPVTRDGAVLPGRSVLFPVATPDDVRTAFRSNLILVNLEDTAQDFTLTAGSLTRTTAVPAGAYSQLTNVGSWLGLAPGYAVLHVRSTGRWGGVVSTIDPVTGDPTTVRGLHPGPWAVDHLGVASAAGTNDTAWRSEAVIHNPAGSVRDFALELYPRDRSTRSLTRTWSFAPGEVRRIADLYAQLGAPAGVARLRVLGGAICWLRTFNQAGTATFGQDLPPMGHGAWVEPDQTVVFPVTSPADPARDFRSNLLVFNHGVSAMTCTLASGTTTRTLWVPEGTYVQVTDLGAWLGLSPGLHVVGVTGDGWWSGVLSSVDPYLGDPTTVLGLVP